MSLQSLNLFRLISVFVIIHPLSPSPASCSTGCEFSVSCVCVPFFHLALSFYIFFLSIFLLSLAQNPSLFLCLAIFRLNLLNVMCVASTDCCVCTFALSTAAKKMFKCLVSMFLYPCAVVVVAAATFRTTPNNSHAQWCGNSEETNETAKMTYFTEAWYRCRSFLRSFARRIRTSHAFLADFSSSSTLTSSPSSSQSSSLVVVFRFRRT